MEYFHPDSSHNQPISNSNGRSLVGSLTVYKLNHKSIGEHIEEKKRKKERKKYR